MFNPANLDAMRNISAEDMKRASEMMAKMSPDDLKRMASMGGMGNVDPAFLSQAANTMSQMSPESLNAMKSAIPQGVQRSQSVPESAAPSSAPQKPSKLDPVIQLKNKGNDFFSKGMLLAAIEQYEAALHALETQVTEMMGELNKRKSAEIKTAKTDENPRQEEEKKVEEKKVEEAPVEESKEEPRLKNHQKDRGIKIEEVLDPVVTKKAAIDPPAVVRSAPVQNPPADTLRSVQPPTEPSHPFQPTSLNPAVLAQQKEALKNMDDAQMKAMLESMKNIDPAFIVQMSKQYGLNITPEQVAMMNQHLTPEVLRGMANSEGQLPTIPPAQQGQDPGVGGAAAMPQFNASMIQESLNNPMMAQMLSGMLSKQFGRTEGEAAMVISCLRRLVNVFLTLSRGYNFFMGGRRKYVTFAVLMGTIAYYYS